MSKNLEDIERDKQRKSESTYRAAKLNEKKSDRELEQEIKKNKGNVFSLEGQHENFVAAVRNEKC